MSKVVWVNEHIGIAGHVQTSETAAVALTIQTNDSGRFAVLTAFERSEGGWQPNGRIWLPIAQVDEVAVLVERAARE